MNNLRLEIYMGNKMVATYLVSSPEDADASKIATWAASKIKAEVERGLNNTRLTIQKKGKDPMSLLAAINPEKLAELIGKKLENNGITLTSIRVIL